LADVTIDAKQVHHDLQTPQAGDRGGRLERDHLVKTIEAKQKQNKTKTKQNKSKKLYFCATTWQKFPDRRKILELKPKEIR
jgi:hypothetical protein